LAAIAVLLVIGVTIGATLLFTRVDSDTPAIPSTSASPGDIASANDNGPVSIITEEPTCDAFYSINNSLADVQSQGWGEQRGALGSVSDWTPDQRSQVQAVAAAIRKAADQMVNLAKRTPHRVVRELYEQYIAYGRAYADRVPTYTPADDALASTNVNINATIFGICNSIDSGAATRAIAAEPAEAPADVAELGDPGKPQRFVTTADQNCASWSRNSDNFDAATVEWQKLDTSTPATQWTPERHALHSAALPHLATWAGEMQSLGILSSTISRAWRRSTSEPMSLWVTITLVLTAG
jgi:hypothetical protein